MMVTRILTQIRRIKACSITNFQSDLESVQTRNDEWVETTNSCCCVLLDVRARHSGVCARSIRVTVTVAISIARGNN